MIFNFMRQINEEILRFLQYFSGYARLADDENKEDPFQKLLFLVRDWSFQNYDYGYYDNDSQQLHNYKKYILDPQSDQPLEIRAIR